MKYNENVKKILSVNPSAFRAIHDALGVDFEQPHDIVAFPGKFTVKQITKRADAFGYGFHAVRVVLTRNTKSWRSGFSVATVNAGGTVNIDIKLPYYAGRPDTFAAKKYFEEIRKSETAETYVIFQDQKYISVPEQKKIDYSARFITKNSDRVNMATDGRGNHWISSIYLYLTDEKGSRIEYRTMNGYYPNEMPREIGEIIDKSGYLLRDRRETWKRRAAALRAEQERDAFIRTENSGKVAELQALIEQRKSDIMEQLKCAETTDELRAVSDALDIWRGLAGIKESFDRFKSRIERKDYPSIEDMNRHYNAIRSQLIKNQDEHAA